MRIKTPQENCTSWQSLQGEISSNRGGLLDLAANMGSSRPNDSGTPFVGAGLQRPKQGRTAVRPYRYYPGSEDLRQPHETRAVFAKLRGG